MRTLFVLLLQGVIGLLPAQPSILDLLSGPYASDLIVNEDGRTIAWVDNAAGESNIFFGSGEGFNTVRQITNYQGDKGIALGDLHFTPSGEHIVFVRGNTKNQKGEPANPALLQENTEQVIYNYDMEKDESIKISSGTQPRISRDGNLVAFIKDGQVWTASLVDSLANPSQLFETRGSQSDINWSPDDSLIAFVSNRGDHSYIGIYDLAEKKLTFKDPTVDRDFSPEWSKDGSQLAYIRRSNSKEIPPFTPQRTAHPWSIRLLDIDTGQARTVWTAEEGLGSRFFGQFPVKALEWAFNNHLIFPWEKKGWMHLYALDITSGEVKHLTPGNGIVEGYEMSVDLSKIYYTTNIGDNHRRHIGVIDLSTMESKLLTIGEGSEYNPVPTSYGVAFLHTAAQYTSRPAILADSNIQLIGDRAITFENHKVPEVIEITATDGASFYGTLLYPDNYDENRTYPVAIFLHGGSRRQMLQTYHYSGYYSNAFALQQYFASQGYMALTINYRSGIGYGLEFREAENYGITGASEVYDLIGAGEYLTSRSDVDPERIALWGGSYGGYLTAHGLARRSDLFAVGVDIHGVHNWNTELPTFAPWYDVAHYPDVAALAFQSSPEAYLDGWKSPVLLIHGDDDRNVPFSETVVLSDQLRDRGVYFEQLIFPDEVHGFLLHDNWVRAYEATFEFIDRHIGHQ